MRHEVTLVSLVQGDPSEAEAIARIREYCEKVYVLPLSRSGSIFNCCRRLFTRMPLQAAYTELPAGAEIIAEIAEAGNFDLVHVEHIRAAHLTAGLRSIPRVYDSVDCITRLLKQRMEHERNPLMRALGLEELLKMRTYEAKTAAGFDRVVITSEQDKRALASLIRRLSASGESTVEDIPSITVAPNGVDTDYFRPMDLKPHPARIVFSGKMSYFANVHAVLKFYREVFPKIRRARPDARFTIVGSNPPEVVRGLSEDPAVEVTGYVADIRPHLASAGVIVCPLSIGVGIQNKVLEAMAMGKPIVASPVACGGIAGAAAGRHLIRAADADAMAESLIKVINNPGYGRNLGENALDLVRRSYSWNAAAKALEAVYTEAADVHRDRVLTAA